MFRFLGQGRDRSYVVWAKMAAMAEGARIASREFWNGSDAARLPAPHDSFATATVAYLREMWVEMWLTLLFLYFERWQPTV